MKALLFTFLLYLTAGCDFPGFQKPKRLSGQRFSPTSSEDIPARYQALKGTVPLRRNDLSVLSGAQRLPRTKAYLYHIIADSFFFYWYGTPWDFNGITEVPNSGKIACGYFVTTVLRDAGFPVARIHLAQAPASDLIRAVCTPASIKRYGKLSDLEAYLNRLPDSSLLLLGLDNHVGFVSRIHGVNYFTHASCVGARAVEQEVLAESLPVKDSRSFMIGNLLTNDALIRQWLTR